MVAAPEAGMLNDLLAQAERASRYSPAGYDAAETERPRIAGESQAAERPQVLAQLAKDISNLIHTARKPAAAPQLQQPAAPPQLQQPAVDPMAAAESAFARADVVVPQEDRSEMWPPLGIGSVAATTAPSEPLPVKKPPLALEQMPMNPGANLGRHASRERLSSHSANSFLSEDDSSVRQVAIRSPREVQALLSSIESRESALRAKVQQLAEEKALQQQRLEEEVKVLQRSNAEMEAELRIRRADSEARALPVVARELPHSRPRSPIEDRSEASVLLQQDTREELQQQLAEIRGEVSRCATALCTGQPLATSEVADIRQQLSALSNEVTQTSHALAPAAGMQSATGARDLELVEVRHQLEALQGQVSRAMYAALSRPGVPAPQESLPRRSAQPDELSELRSEVGNLRAELARVGGHSTGSRASSVGNARSKAEVNDLGMQLEALRTEFTGVFGGPRSMQPQVPSLPLSQEQPRMPQPFSEAASLQERLSWLRSEVAAVVQDPQYTSDAAPPEMQQKLNGLLCELQDLRHGAEAVAAATGGSPLRRSASGLMAVPQVWVRSSTPLRPLRRSDSASLNGSVLVDATPSIVQPVYGMSTAPVYVCPHVAADLAPESSVGDWYSNRYAERYVDRERLAAEGVTRGMGLQVESAPSATPTLGRIGNFSSQSSSIMLHPPKIGNAAAPPGSIAAGQLSSAYSLSRPGYALGGHTAQWGVQASASAHSSSRHASPTLATFSAEAPSAPADEPPEVAPQGNMWRPMRSKISRP